MSPRIQHMTNPKWDTSPRLLPMRRAKSARKSGLPGGLLEYTLGTMCGVAHNEFKRFSQNSPTYAYLLMANLKTLNMFVGFGFSTSWSRLKRRSNRASFWKPGRARCGWGLWRFPGRLCCGTGWLPFNEAKLAGLNKTRLHADALKPEKA